ncbi:hypothetical protein [Paenibacillus sp. FSL R5-0914]|uniref:hypothetical protein n=1 Tax=Paenibacillus sp. FSL R5-0914 TaxID=2921665 RepID=UPI0030F8D929
MNIGHRGTVYFCGNAKRQGFRAVTISSHAVDDPKEDLVYLDTLDRLGRDYDRKRTSSNGTAS